MTSRGLKFLLIAAALFGFFAAQTVVAKEPHTHHTASGKNTKPVAKGDKAKTNRAKSGEGASTKSGSPANTPSSESTDTVPVPHAKGMDKAHIPSLSVKVAKPVNPLTRDIGTAVPVKPVTHNAIGEPITERVSTTGGESHLSAAVQLPGTSAVGLAHQPLHPIANPITPDRGKVDGSHLIRTTATSELGGPAKSVTGINGTTIRPKY